MKNLAIGQAAAATGLSADTIRYYERRGTIPRSDRTDNGGAQPSVLRSQLSAIDGLVMGEGTIYPILSRFKKEGLVETTLAESSEGPARKYYQLTGRGRLLLGKMLRAWAEVRDGIEAVTGAESLS